MPDAKPILIVDGKRYEVVDFRAPRKSETILSACCRAYLSDEDYPMQDERCILRELPSPVTDGGLERRGDWVSSDVGEDGNGGVSMDNLIDAACAVVNDYGTDRWGWEPRIPVLHTALKPFTRPTKTERFTVEHRPESGGTNKWLVRDEREDWPFWVGNEAAANGLRDKMKALAATDLSQGEGE